MIEGTKIWEDGELSIYKSQKWGVWNYILYENGIFKLKYPIEKECDEQAITVLKKHYNKYVLCQPVAQQ